MSPIESEVARALHRHAWGFDEGDWDLLGSAYTEDATVDVVTGFASRGERPWHLITNVLVDQHDEHTAKVRSFNLFLKSTPSGVAVFGMSRYHDDMVKVGGEWRIRARVNRISYAAEGAARPSADER